MHLTSQPIPTEQFIDTSVRVPKRFGLCATRRCNCLKRHMEKLDKRLIRNTTVTEKQEGRDTLLISVFAKDDQIKDNKEMIFITCSNRKLNSSLISTVVEVTQ